MHADLQNVFCHSSGLYLQVLNQPGQNTQLVNNLLGDLDDPTSQFSTLVASGNTQAMLGYTFAKTSLINIPPDMVRCSDFHKSFIFA